MKSYKSLKDLGEQADTRKQELEAAVSAAFQSDVNDINFLLSEVRKLHALLGTKNCQLEKLQKENKSLKEKLETVTFDSLLGDNDADDESFSSLFS